MGFVVSVSGVLFCVFAALLSTGLGAIATLEKRNIARVVLNMPITTKNIMIFLLILSVYQHDNFRNEIYALS